MRRANLNQNNSKFISLLLIKCLIGMCFAGKSGPCAVRKFPYDHDIWDALLMSYDDCSTVADAARTQRPEGTIPAPEEVDDRSSPEEGPFLEGDIIPSASSVQYDQQDLRWPNATVPFQFHTMMSYDGRMQVLRAMNEYHAHTCIQFKKRNGERDYLVIGSSYHWLCASSVGRQGGAQMLHLGPACTRAVGTPMHELMHALGFFHEHMRPDRDNYVFINYSNIDEHLWKNFRELHLSYPMSDLKAGYDFESLMHYRICAMTNNSWPTILPRVHAKINMIGQREGFSKKDIIKINSFYNCSGRSSIPKMFPLDFNHPRSVNTPKNNAANSIKTYLIQSCTTTILIKYTINFIYSHCVFHCLLEYDTLTDEH